MAWHQSPRGGDRSSHGERSVESLTRPDRDGIPPSGNLYGVPANPLCDDGADKALRLMLRDVRFDVRSGTLAVTNRATGGRWPVPVSDARFSERRVLLALVPAATTP